MLAASAPHTTVGHPATALATIPSTSSAQGELSSCTTHASFSGASSPRPAGPAHPLLFIRSRPAGCS
eukprot:1862325-Alexandrium_andersonii.AAC.1